MPLQFRSPKRSPPFPSHVYYSSSCQTSSPLSKFERASETIKNNNKDYKETLRKYNSRKPRREVGKSEHVGPILISDFEEEWGCDDLQQQQEGPSQ